MAASGMAWRKARARGFGRIADLAVAASNDFALGRMLRVDSMAANTALNLMMETA